MKTSYLDRDCTGAIKGIGLILMFIHHFFTFPSWHVDAAAYPWLRDFADAYCSPTDLCVAIFAFLTGYFYFFSRTKTLRYSLRKITDLLVSYWLVYLPFLGIAVVLGCHTFSFRGFVYELFGLTNSVMSFCWYVYFYCIMMLLLPLLCKPEKRSPVMDVLMLLLLPALLLRCWLGQSTGGIFYSVLYNTQLWFPCISGGYLWAKYSLFENFFDKEAGLLPSRAAKILVYALVCWAAFRGRYWIQEFTIGSVEIRTGIYGVTFTMDLLFAPLFVWGAANLLGLVKHTILFRLLEKIGRHSMLMWFLHCIFFNVCKEYTQPILYFPKNPVLVTLNGLVLCYLAAAALDPLLKLLLKGKNKLLEAVHIL